MKAVLVVLMFAGFASAQTPNAATIKSVYGNPAKWPVCQLGKAPIAPGPAPELANPFKAKGGPVFMSESGRTASEPGRWIVCNLPEDTDIYWWAGSIRDVASNQPFYPIGWEPPATTPVNGRPGEPGLPGANGTNGSSCSVSNNGNDTYTLSCTDGTSVVVRNGKDGRNGTNGTNATATATANNTWQDPMAKFVTNDGFHCRKGCKVLIGVGIVAGVAGGVFATHGHSNGVTIGNAPPVGITTVATGGTTSGTGSSGGTVTNCLPGSAGCAAH